MLLLTGAHEHDPRKHDTCARKVLITYSTVLRTRLRHPEQRGRMYNAITENSGCRAGCAWVRTRPKVKGLSKIGKRKRMDEESQDAPGILGTVHGGRTQGAGAT